jgi:hypothetical protein
MESISLKIASNFMGKDSTTIQISMKINYMLFKPRSRPLKLKTLQFGEKWKKWTKTKLN